MLGHQVGVDRSHAVGYVEDYLECVESLPLDMQRNVSLLLEIDNKYQEVLKEVDDVYERYKKEPDGLQRKRLQNQLQRALICSQELGDEKIHVVTQMMELVENRARQMDSHSRCFQEAAEPERVPEVGLVGAGPVAIGGGGAQERLAARRPRRQRHSESRDSCSTANGLEEPGEDPPPAPPPPPSSFSSSAAREKRSKSAKKKKRSRAKQERETSPVDYAIDPNEPTYCLCDQVSYGEMIGCDNEQCPIEWFHFSCVGLTYKPKGKWYCPRCRGDNEKTMERSFERSKKDRRSR